MDFTDEISLRKLHYNDVESWLNFAWHYSPTRFKKAFERVGVLVEGNKDVTALYHLAETSGDKNGNLKSSSGKSIKFSVLEVVKSIPTDVSEIDNKFILGEDMYLVKVDKRKGIS